MNKCLGMDPVKNQLRRCILKLTFLFGFFFFVGFKFQVIEDPELRERHLGDLQGLVFREAAKVCPIAYQAFLSGKTDQDIPVSLCNLKSVSIVYGYFSPDNISKPYGKQPYVGLGYYHSDLPKISLNWALLIQSSRKFAAYMFKHRENQ